MFCSKLIQEHQAIAQVISFGKKS